MSFQRNLLKNPNGSESFKHWIPISVIEKDMEKLINRQRSEYLRSHYEGWTIETDQNGVVNKDKNITSNFVTSKDLVGKAQVIDIKDHGINF